MPIESVNRHALAAFEDLSQCIGLDPNDLGGTATMTGEDFPRVSVHRLASASSAALAAVGIGVGGSATVVWSDVSSNMPPRLCA